MTECIYGGRKIYLSITCLFSSRICLTRVGKSNRVFGSIAAFPVQLVGVVNVVPHTVKAAGNGGDGSEERVAHPDGQHGVFLSQRLAGRDAVTIPVTDAFAEPELEGATQ